VNQGAPQQLNVLATNNLKSNDLKQITV